MNVVQQLTEMGVSVWLDGLDRGQLANGEFRRFLRDYSITGVTTNCATLRDAVTSAPDAYAAQLADAQARRVDPVSTLRGLAMADVRNACDELRPVFDATGGVDGYASIGVDPRFADDVGATIADARSLTWVVDRPNLLITIPATETGLAAIASCLAEGIGVNATLIFGLHRYAQVIDAYMDALERRRASGRDLRTVTSVASFVVTRVNAAVPKTTGPLAAAEEVPGEVAVASARLAYRLFLRSLRLPRWSTLAAAGARPQRPLWAAASTSDPALTLCLTEPAAADVIVTLAASTLAALARAATIAAQQRADESVAQRALSSLAAAGIDYDQFAKTLEREGVGNLTAAWHDAMGAVHTARSNRTLHGRVNTPTAAATATADPPTRTCRLTDTRTPRRST